MRRFVAALTGKRSDKSDVASNASSADRTAAAADTDKPTPHKRTGFFKSKSFSRGSSSQQENKQRNLPKPPVLTTPEHAPSSSSSSSGGPSTPHDDSESVGHHHMKPWAPLTYLHDKVLPPIAAQDPSKPYIPLTFSQEDDSLSVHSDELSSFRLPQTMESMPPAQPIMPSAYCRAIASNALEPPFSPPPLLVVPNAPLYPRSCNSPQQLSRTTESLYRQLSHRRILRQLDSTPADRYLAPFANRKTLPPQHRSLHLDDVAIPKGYRVASSSLGLRRWIERPCFEDRVLIYLPENQNGGLICERVSATAAVEALDYSEALDALAGMPYEEVATVNQDLLASSPASLTPPLSSTPSTASFSSLPPSPAVFAVTDLASSSAQNAKPLPAVPYNPYKSSPSPLRKDYTTETSSRSPPPARSVSTPTIPSSPTRPASLTSSVSSPNTTMSPAIEVPRVGVRFADEEKDENVPLDYVMRIKQARDQKAKFLAAERARRQTAQGSSRPSSVRPSLNNSQQMREDLKRVAEERRRLEEEKKRYEAERRRQEEEQRQYEKERAAWEREKKLAEEGRKQKAFADEIVEARRRRESARQGSVTKIDNLASWTGDREKERERKESSSRPRYARPKYDDVSSVTTRREVTDASLGGSSTSLRLQIPANSSPGSSRPPSIATGSVRESSRPPSMYSTPPSSASAIDIRQRRESKASRRTSFMSEGGALAAQQMYMQGGMPTVYPWAVPPVPPVMNMNMMPGAMPMPMMQMQMPMMPYSDMPLLPPSAPFMQQGPRQHRSHSASPTRSTAGSDRRSLAGQSSSHSSHRRMPSDEPPKRQQMSRSSSYGTSLSSSLPPQHYPSPTTLQSDRLRSSGASYRSTATSSVRPTPVQSRTQSGFQNLSRPPSDRRQTMIR